MNKMCQMFVCLVMPLFPTNNNFLFQDVFNQVDFTCREVLFFPQSSLENRSLYKSSEDGKRDVMWEVN